MLLAGIGLAGDHHAGSNFSVLAERRLDLSWFDTETAYLQLLVVATEVLDPAVGEQASPVAGPVREAVLEERVGAETQPSRPADLGSRALLPHHR